MTAQIHKHIDKETPIRFLIAECESPATVLIAVFFAKLSGVEHMYMNHADMSAFVARDYRNWGELIKAANIKSND